MKRSGFKVWLIGIVFLLAWVSLVGCGGGATDTKSSVTGTAITDGSKSSPPKDPSAATSPGVSSSSSEQKPTELIDVSVLSSFVSGASIPIWVAYDNDLFQKYGINPKWNLLPPPTGVQALLSKDVQIGDSPGNAINAYASGGKELVYVGGSSDKPVYRIMANNITKPEDLRGKKLGVSGRYAPPAVTAMYYFEKQFNLKPDVDYKVVPFQQIGDILPALSRGLIDAGVVSTPLHLKAEKLGAKLLVDLSKTVDQANNYILTTRTFAKQNPEAVSRFLKAYIAGIEMAKKNPDIAIASITKHQTGITDEESRVTYYDYIGNFGVNMNPQAFISFQIYTDNPKTSSINVAEMMDFSFLEQLDKSGFLKEHGFTFIRPETK